MKTKTIDDLTGEKGGFKRFLREKTRVIQAMEQERKDRIKGKKPKRSRVLAKYSDQELLSMMA